MNILITGGTGFIGEELRMMLLKEGHNLVIVTRNPGKYENESAKNQEFISWDDDLSMQMNTMDAVINLAGENLFGQRWSPEVKKRIQESRVNSTEKLVEAMRNADNPPQVFVSASASGIYGDNGDKVLSEEAKVADDFLAEVCQKWEAASQKASEFGVRVVNPRIGIVLEEGGGALEKMLTPFRLFVGGPVGSGEQYMSWVHRTDLCRALIFPIDNEKFSGAYNVCAPNPVTMNSFAGALGEQMNRPSVFRVPEFVLGIVLGESAKPVTDSIRMQPKKLQISGFEFRFEEIEEALADIVW
ncbi:MAG: TIGR01777 family oxidoreductase [Gracilimonas sp.]|nr:TIGR01777 family oxidoreductase [Gracilimonas sp.]